MMLPVKTITASLALVSCFALLEAPAQAQEMQVTIVNLTDRAAKFRIKSGDQERTYVLRKDSKILRCDWADFFMPPERKIHVAGWVKTKGGKGFFKIFGGGSKPVITDYQDVVLVLYYSNGKYRMDVW